MKFVTFLLLIVLGGCQFAGTIYSATSKVTTVLLDDRSFGDDITDTKINMALRNALAEHDVKYALDIEVTVFEGKVLLTGALPGTDLITDVLQIAYQTDNVKQVYNYIRLANPPAIDVVNQDAAISAKLRTQLTMTAGISSSNYKITMENGTVYLMGISESAEELDRVIAVAKNTIGVHKVVVLTRMQ